MSDTPHAASSATTVTAVAPGAVVLIGEHAVDHGQPAIAAAVGLWATCRAAFSPDERFVFRSGVHEQAVDEEHVRQTWEALRNHFYHEDHAAIRAMADADSFAAQKYVLGAMFGGRLRRPLSLVWESEVLSRAGLDVGGPAFVAMVSAVCALLLPGATAEERAAWAHHGEEVTHGGDASALDVQTSLVGGVVRFTGRGVATRLRVARGLTLVVGDTGVRAQVGEVKERVRRWLEARPTARTHAIRSVGTLTAGAVAALERGDWAALGRVMDLNQLVLEKVGAVSAEAGRLIGAALDAGALGAKVSGPAGDLVVALATPETRAAVARAIGAAGGKPVTAEAGVAGASAAV